MKTILRSLLFAGLLISSISYADAQVYVRTRPVIPRTRVVIAHPPAPSPRHIWVREDWRPYRRSYRYTGGYWAAPPRPRVVWVPGYWAARPRGHVWIPGYWR